MKTEWDYTDLAEAYLKRPDYAQGAIDQMLEACGVQKGDKACDVGAGAAHLTLKLAGFGLQVCAVEPNDAMRANGIKEPAGLKAFHGMKVLGSIREWKAIPFTWLHLVLPLMSAIVRLR